MVAGWGRWGCSGSANLSVGWGEVGVRDGVEVAGGGFDAEPEQVADEADVAAGGVDLVEYAVLAQGSGPQRDAGPGVLGPTGTSRGAVRLLMSRWGLALPGQVRLRWSSQAARRVRTGAASGTSRSARTRAPSRMSVSCRCLSCLPVRAWKATRATARATTGSGFSSSRITAGSRASGMVAALGRPSSRGSGRRR